MTAYYCIWLAHDRWLARRARADTAGADEALGRAVLGVLALPSELHEDVGVLHLPDSDIVARVMLEGPRPRLLSWTGRDLVAANDDWTFDDALDLGPKADDAPDRLILSLEIELAQSVSAAELGAGLYGLLENDTSARSVTIGGYFLALRGTAVSSANECLVVFYRGMAHDGARLTPAQVSEARALLRPRAARARRAAGRLTPVLFSFAGGGVDDEGAAITTGRGTVGVLFGKNGAGKTALIGAIDRALSAPLATRDREHVAAAVLLSAPAQTQAEAQFANLIAHLCFQPLSDIPEHVLGGADLPLRGWNDFSAYDATTGALAVQDLLQVPLPELQGSLAQLLSSLLAPLLPGARAFAEFVATSPHVSAAAGGRVALAVDPADADDDVRAAAHEMMVLSSARQAPLPLPGALYPLYRCAQDVALSRLGGPRPVLSVQLAQHALGVTVAPESGWLDAGRELERMLRDDLPRPVLLAPGRQPSPGLADRAEAALLRLQCAFVGGEVGSGPHPFAQHPGLAARLARLFQDEMKRLLPRFVSDAGKVGLEIADTTTWHDRRVSVSFVGGGGGEAPVDALPAGFGTWLHASVLFAEQRLLHATWSVQTRFGPASVRLQDDYVRLESMQIARESVFQEADPESIELVEHSGRLTFLLDEPEVHLHLTAQRDVVDVAALLARDSAGVVVATHALAFLDAGEATTAVHTLVHRDGRTHVSPATGLAGLSARAADLGVPPSAMAQVCRGALLVEGVNDVEVLRRYGGVDLDAERVLVIPLQGHHGAVNLAEAEFLHSLRIPLFIMLDAVRRSLLVEALERRSPRGISGEEQTLLQLHQALERGGLTMSALPFAGRDIVTAVPEADVDRLLVAAGAPPFIGWKLLGQSAETAWASSRTKFKDVFRKQTKRDVDAVLRDLRSSDLGGQSPELKGLLAALLEQLRKPAEAQPGLVVLKRR